MNQRALRSTPVLVAALFAATCSSTKGSTVFQGGGGAASDSSSTGGSGDSEISGLFDASPGGDSNATIDGGSPTYLVYANTDTTLFTVNPVAPADGLTTVGDFDCIGAAGTPGQQSTAMTDIAVDSQQNLWGLSSFAVRPLSIQGSTVHCGTPIYLHIPDPNATADAGAASWIRFEALTFAPVPVLSPVREVLVAGNTTGQLWQVNPDSSHVQRGYFGTVPADDGRGHVYQNAGKAWELSGDIVFLANGDKPIGFATVRDCPNPPDPSNCDRYPDGTTIVDTLIEIDMDKLGTADANTVVTKAVRGKVVPQASGCGGSSGTDYGHLYGIAAWNDQVFGFSRTGNLVEVGTKDGSTCLVQNFLPNKFAGAGVTTVAPVVAPPDIPR